MPTTLLPTTLWLVPRATDRAKYHATLECPSLEWVSEKHAPAELADVMIAVRHDLDDALSGERNYCRNCALQDATHDVLATAQHPGEPTVRTTLAAVPAPVKNKPHRAASDTANARLAHVAAAFGYQCVTALGVGVTLYGDLPAAAVDFLAANYWMSTPPAALATAPLTGDLVATAWDLLAGRRMPVDETWETAYAVHA